MSMLREISQNLYDVVRSNLPIKSDLKVAQLEPVTLRRTSNGHLTNGHLNNGHLNNGFQITEHGSPAVQFNHLNDVDMTTPVEPQTKEQIVSIPMLEDEIKDIDASNGDNNMNNKGDGDAVSTSSTSFTIRGCFTVGPLCLIIYNLYLIISIYKTWHKCNDYGEGIKFLTVITSVGYFIWLYQLFLRDSFFIPMKDNLVIPFEKVIKNNKFLSNNLRKVIWSFLFCAIVLYSVMITSGNRYRLVSGLGIFGFIFIGFCLSEHKSRINWNQVIWGLTLQFALALFVLRTSFGRGLFQCLGQKVATFLKFTDHGSSFVFGYLVTGQTIGEDNLMPIFAFKILPVILFFSFFVSILYYYGVMQVVVMKAGWALQSIIGTTACESLNAAANIFLGMTEAPLVIKPFIPLMTKSELFAVMTGGFATIAGAVLAAFINFGISPSHLLVASVMAAPAALGISKLFYPETEESKTQAENIKMEKGTETNALEAAGNGASQAIMICANIAANMIAFLAFIKFMDFMCQWVGTNIDLPFISFEWILSKLFIPLSLMMGVEWADCDQVAKLIGIKTLVNEFVAYSQLAKIQEEGTMSDRSVTIATYALCGFSNFASIGITLGAFGSIVPERKADLSSMALKSMVAGSTVTFISACMAGLLVES